MHTSRSSGGQVPMVSKETSENLDVCNTVTLKEMLRKQIETFAIIREAWRWAILAAVFGREWLSKRTLCLNGTLEELVNVLLLSWYASSDRQWRERERESHEITRVHEPNNLIIEVYHMLDISVTGCVTGVQISVSIPECITSFYGHHSMIQFPHKKCMLGHARRTSALLSHSHWPQDFPAGKCY